MRLFTAILILLMLNAATLCSQSTSLVEPDSLLSYFQFEESSLLSCLTTYFPPLFIQNGIELKSFIASPIFRSIRQKFGDTRAVDAIYTQAMRLTNNNTAMALLLSSISTFDHRMVGFRVPVFLLSFPLSNESETEFLQRVNNLPCRLYSDSPESKSGDRDKLQHFFGSAFVAFVFESRGAAERVGEFVEEGEDAVIIDGALDERDIRANRHGQDFGLALLTEYHHLPSEFMKYQIALKTEVTEERNCCAGAW